MPSLNVSYTTAHATRIVNAMAGLHNYQETVSNPDYDSAVEGSEPTIANPESKAEFAKRILFKEYPIAQVKRWEDKLAKDAAQAENEIDVTIS